MIDGGAVQDPTLPVISFEGGLDETASTIDGWRRSSWTRTLGDLHGNSAPGGYRDEFVIFTDRDGASDTDYMDLAYWIQYRPGDSALFENSPVITTISIGSTLLEPGVGAHANGSATYSGPAIGLYAKKERGVYHEHGEFRAQAALRANFDAPQPVQPADGAPWKPPISVSGTISDFKDAQGNVIDNSWKVTLQEQLFDGSKSGDEYQEGTTAGGKPYTFNFFGPATADVRGKVNPEYIGGSFSESFNNGAVSGAFAAKRKP